ncbi:MAG: hypothetical protein JNK82_40490 [Myxococcaceae bacterium]|nr:hypothetical protein [Myxococcaceae bacterium]
MAEHPVFVEVGGQKVKVGTATKDGDGFVLRLGELSIGGTAAPASAFRPSGAFSGGGGGDMSGGVLPNYGRSKGAPVRGASMQDLEFYLNGCKRTLADPSKARFHDKERQLMAQLEAEIARQRGGGGDDGDGPPPPGDDDAPPF